MKLIDLVQRSTAWHEWRSEGLGASAAATIMGSSPWETPIQLWKRMMGLEDPIATTPAMQRGIDYEDEWQGSGWEQRLVEHPLVGSLYTGAFDPDPCAAEQLHWEEEARKT